MPYGLLAVVLVAAAAAVGGWSIREFPHGDAGASARVWAAHLLLQTLVFASFVWLRRTRLPLALERWTPRIERHALWGAVAVLVFAYLLTRLTTPAVPLNDGYGADGVVYRQMVEKFGWYTTSAVPPYNRRFLLPFLVHASGLPTTTGYHAINAVSFLVSGLLVFALARRLGARAAVALACVALFATLRMGLKFWVYYPVLNDAPGTAFLLALAYCTVRGWNVAHALTLSAAVCCRENLIVVAPFHVLYQLARTGGRASLRAAAWQLIPAAVFVWSWRSPVFAPSVPFSQAHELRKYLQAAFTADRQARIVLGHVSGLGLLVLLPALHTAGRAALRRVLRQPAWMYYAAVTLLLSVLGGHDIDRFVLWQLPVLIAVAAAAGPPGSPSGPSPWFWAHAVALHAAAMHFFYWHRSWTYALGLTAAHAPPPWYGYLFGSWLVAGGVTAAMLALDPLDYRHESTRLMG